MSTRYWDYGNSDGDLSATANWSANTIPIANDSVFFEHIASGSDIDTSLDELSNTSLSGNLDLVCISAAAGYGFGTVTAYVQLGTDECDIGFWRRGGTRPEPSGRVMLDFGTQATNCRVYCTAQTATDSNLEPVRLLFGSSSASLDVYAESTTTQVGIATTNAAETSTLGTLTVHDANATVTGGFGLTLTTAETYNGRTLLQKAPTTMNCYGGSLRLSAAAGTVTTARCKRNGTLDLSGCGVTVTNAIELWDGAILDLRGFVGTLSGGIKSMETGEYRVITDSGFTF